jgi:putative hydrolase of the HAD superfamily
MRAGDLLSPEPLTDTRLDFDRLKVIVFDVDGTLYRQGPLRRAMLLRLLRTTVARPVEGLRTLRALEAYRRAQEELRGRTSGAVAREQIRLACERAKCDPAFVTACVDRWMEQEPLDLLQGCAYSGLVEFLDACRARGLRIAALSDYPAAAKLRALGIAERFELVLCAQEPDVDVFKPHPRGLQVVLQRLGVFAHECLYVGDRAEVDAAAARAAGIPCVILTREGSSSGRDYTTVASYRQLQELLVGDLHVPFRNVISSES